MKAKGKPSCGGNCHPCDDTTAPCFQMSVVSPISMLFATGGGFDYDLSAGITSYDPEDLPRGDPIYCVWNSGTGQYDCKSLVNLVDADSADVSPTIADRYEGDTTFRSYLPASPGWGVGNRCQGNRGYDALTNTEDAYDGTPASVDVTACVTGPGGFNPRFNWGVLPNYAGGCHDITLGPNKFGPFRLRWYRSNSSGLASATGEYVSIILDTDSGSGIGSWWAIVLFYRSKGSTPTFWHQIPDASPIVLAWTPGEAFSTVDAPTGPNITTAYRQPMPNIELRSGCEPYTPPNCDEYTGCFPVCIKCPTVAFLALVIEEDPSCCLSGTFDLYYNGVDDQWQTWPAALEGDPPTSPGLADRIGGPDGVCGIIEWAILSCGSDAEHVNLQIRYLDVNGGSFTANYDLAVTCSPSFATDYATIASNPFAPGLCDGGFFRGSKLRVVSV